MSNEIRQFELESVGLGDDEDVVAYTLRHTFATRLMRLGTPLPVLQTILGHTDLSTTQRYLKVDQRDQDKWVKKLGGGS